MNSRHAATLAVFYEMVDDYLETFAQLGQAPERPYSGKLMLRIDSFPHASTAKAAELAGMSLNHWTEKSLRSAVTLA